MKKIFIPILSIVVLNLVAGLFSSSNLVLANPLIEEMEDLIVLEGNLDEIDIEALIADAFTENSLHNATEIEAIIMDAAINEHTVFILNQPSHLALFLDGIIANNGDTILLGSSIDMSEFPMLSGRSYFNGTFDGNGLIISNLRIESNGTDIGFINESSQITLRNMTFENLQVVGNDSSNTGGLIGLLNDFSGPESSTIGSVNITGNSFVREGLSIGGFVGRLEATSLHILNSKNYATVYGVWPNSSSLQIGGFVGVAARSNLYISNSKNHGNIPGFVPQIGAGGFIGRAYGDYQGPSIKINTIEIFNSDNHGSVTNNSRAAGGFIGSTSDSAFNQLNIVIDNGTNYGHIIGIGSAGGFIGESFNFYSLISLTNVYNKGYVEGPGVLAGGIIGQIQSDRASSAQVTLIDVSNSGNISGPFAGGIIGRVMFAHVTIQDATNTGNVTGSNGEAAWDAGGIIGFITSSNITIENAVNSGMIYASNAGGILGAVFHETSYVVVTNWTNPGLIIGTSNAGQGVGLVDSGATVIM